MTIRFRQSIAMAFAIIATSFSLGILVVVVGVHSFQIGSPPTVAVVGRSLRSCKIIINLQRHHPAAVTTLSPNHLRLPIAVTRHSTRKYCPSSTTSHFNLFATSFSNANSNEAEMKIDSLILRTSKVLRASSWFSWWSQVILTVISSITFLFARNVMTMPTSSGIGQGAATISKFFLPGLGIAASSLSIIWTWGQRRLARRFVRPRRIAGGNSANSKSSSTTITTTTTTTTSRIEAANLLRSTIKFGVSINLFGLLTSVLGAQYIIGTLVAKSMQSFVGLGGNVVTSQTLQPLDVLVVQANTNVLSSHFVSLVCLLWLTRMVDLLDPPSLEEDDVI